MENQSLEDRISQLPREIRVHILSRMTVKDAARTSVLSKDWIDLWMGMAALNFDAFEVLEKLSSMRGHQRLSALEVETRKYVKWVNKVLQSHNVMPMDELRICFELDRSSTNDIDKWLHYAFSRKVRRLELDLVSDGHAMNFNPRAYTFPHGLLGLSNGRTSTSNESPSGYSALNGVESLRSSRDALNGFESLRSLRLSGVAVTGDIFKLLLHKCHFLEHLAVNGSKVLMSVEVCGSSLALRHLEICYCMPLESIIVCDTNLVSLKISSNLVRSLVFKNVPMLVDVWVHGMAIKDFVSLFSCCLSNLVFLTLFSSHLQMWQDSENVVEIPRLAKLKQLTLITGTYKDYSVIPFTSLIRASPNLEKFVFKLAWLPNTARIEREFEKAASSCPIPHLKVFEIHGYCGRTAEDELVEYILVRAVALERITIDCRDQRLIGKFQEKQPELENVARSKAKELVEKLMLTSPSVDVVLI